MFTRLKRKNPAIQVIGLQPLEGSQIAGIRRWPEAYLPTIFERSRVDVVMDVSQHDAENTMRRLAREEGIFAEFPPEAVFGLHWSYLKN